ncbi:carbohydrate-binding protein, partial [Streptomyces sp. DT225]
VLDRNLEAADYDEQLGTAIVDRAKTDGDAVTATGESNELLYRRCDFGAATSGVEVLASGEGAVLITVDGSTVTVPVPATDGPYDYRTLHTGLTASGVGDLRVALRGTVRLARLGFTGAGA